MYSWGSGYKMKTGLGDSRDVPEPTLVSAMRELSPVTKVLAGGIHSACLGTDGMLYTFGCGSNGRLGHPECEGKR